MEDLEANIGTPLSIPCEASKWKAPAVDDLKINVDVGLTRDENTFWDMLVRDCAGSVIYAAMKSEEVQVCPILAGSVIYEGLLDCARILLWLHDQNHRMTNIEMDAEMVVNCLKNQSHVSEILEVILGCRDILS
ncbi:hypothetical protein TSUD_270490 [Trifolium subterraneum]|uniref:RNase H type-1 domain-containing protein n=1 Tax=Trifolium subterraneum TaxID=3900 RepID=A0A2Z6NTM2_TRISU|nr:hypothetical protein TSUD_270490 [Trifolium subterraneum]